MKQSIIFIAGCSGWPFAEAFERLIKFIFIRRRQEEETNRIMADIDEHQKITSVSAATPLKNSSSEDEAENGGGGNNPEITQYQAYPIRWLILFLFVMYSTSNAFQWTQLVIITNILEKYYQVPTIAVSWTSMIYMVTYIPLIFPASWFLQKKVLYTKGNNLDTIG